MAGYVRQSTADIIPTATVRAAPINAEYNALRDAFAASGGHKHDGTTGEGEYVPLIADLDALNKVVIDTTNNRVGVFVEVSAAAVEQIRIQDGVIVPVTDNDIDLGTSSLEFKDLYLDGTAYIDTLAVHESATITSNFSVNGNTTLGNAASDTVTFTADVASSILPSADDTYDLGSSASQWRNLYIDGTANIDSLVADTADINGGTLDGVTIGGGTAAAADFTTMDASGNATVGGTLGVTGATTLASTLTVTGATALNGGLTLDTNKFTVADTTGNTAIAGTLDVTGATALGSTLDVTGATTVANFTATGTTVLPATSFGDNNITNVGNIALDSITADGSSITITGNTTFADGAYDFDIASHDTSNGLKLAGTLVTATATELNYNDTGSSVGTVVASKTVTVDGNKDVSSFRNLTATGDITTGNLVISNGGNIGSASDTNAISIASDGDVTVSQSMTVTGDLTVNGSTNTISTTNTVIEDALIELGTGTTGTPSNDAGIVIERGDSNNAFIGFDESEDKFKVGTGTFTGADTGNLTITTGTLVANIEGNLTGTVTGNASGLTGMNTAISELNVMDGDTAATSTTLADADRVVVNDAGTMKQVALTDFETYFESALDTLSNVTTVGTLNSGSITSGFGSIDNGSSAITTTGTITFGTLSDGSDSVTDIVTSVGSGSANSELPTALAVENRIQAVSAISNNVTGLNATGAELNAVADVSAITIDTSTAIANNDGIAVFDSSASAIGYFDVDLLDTYFAGTTKTLTNKTLTSPTVSGLYLSDAGFIVEGSSADGNEATVTFTDPTADRTITFPDSTGTVALSGATQNVDFGTVTADGLTVDNISLDGNTLSTTSSFLLIQPSTALVADSTASTVNIRTQSLDRLVVNNNGDISFYEDTGTTAKFFWDASAEGLSLGHTGNTSILDVLQSDNITDVADVNSGAKFGRVNFSGNGQTSGLFLLASGNGGSNNGWAGMSVVQPDANSNNADLTFITRGSSIAERMRISSTGNVGIGTSSPQSELHVSSSANADLRLSNDTVGNTSSDGLTITMATNGNASINNRENASTLFYTNNSEAMRITSSGNVGINTASPATELDVQGTTTTNGLNLDAISETISDTAVDIFVYDTRKDSDGGAWRKRTQHTSWYNETLNTATRGSRKEFPSVAVIVAESNQVTIYDGDDPSLPMWMVFSSGTTWTQYTGGFAVEMLNGIMFIGRSASNGRGLHIGFVNDFAFDVATTSTGAKRVPILNGVVNRNAGNAYDGGTIDSTFGIVERTINDVAMTVLPNAPIDAATGLPVPTIAVATDGGVSVIKDDGTVVNYYTSSASWAKTKNVEFYNNEEVVFTTWSGSSFSRIGWKIPLRSSDISLNEWEIDAASYTNVFTGRTGSNVVVPNQIENSNILELSTSRDFIHLGCDNGLTKYDFKGAANNITNSVAYISTDYNTGWMNGDIKLATLSDTDDTDVTGSELVTNGTFDTDTSNWDAGNGATLSVDTQRLKIQGGGTNNPKATSAHFTTVVGQTYVASVSVDMGNASTPRMRVATSDGSGYGDVSATADGVITKTFTATTTSTEVMLYLFNETSTYAFFDNVSVRLAEEDRSVNGNGLQVFGTVTKNPVATGADLVAYSGWSNNNYMKQPYNASLPTGGSDPFAVMMWFKVTGVNATEVVVQFGANTTGQLRQFNMNSTGNPYFAVSGQNTGNSQECEDNVWHHWATVHDGNKNISTFIDGRLIHTQLFSGLADASTEEPLWVGNDYNGDNGFSGSLALLRISATAPSPEQIKRIYNDEKVLFQENAQATLYGSSDAVTALAYDDSTNLLHVGTSAGRSVFQGLRRVDNTTTAVGAAISASNGLVADE